MADDTQTEAKARTVTASWVVEVPGVIWDGSPEVWEAILAMEHDDCWLDPERPGLVFRYGHGDPIPVGTFLYLDDHGVIVYRSLDSVRIVRGEA